MYVVRRATRPLGREPCTDEIAVSIIVPEWARIIPSGGAPNWLRRRPGTGRIYGCTHKESLVRSAEVNPILPGVVPDRAGPDAASRPVHLVPVQLRVQATEILHHVSDDFPIDQVFRVQDHHAWRILKRGRDSIKILTQTECVKITEVGWHHGIRVCAVPLIAPFATRGFIRTSCHRQNAQEKAGSYACKF